MRESHRWICNSWERGTESEANAPEGLDHGTGRSFLLKQGDKEAKLVGPWDDVQTRQIPAPRDQIRDDERVLSKPELDGFKQFRESIGTGKLEKPFDKLPEPIQKLRLWATSLPQSNVTNYDPYGAEEVFLLFADGIAGKHLTQPD